MRRVPLNNVEHKVLSVPDAVQFCSVVALTTKGGKPITTTTTDGLGGRKNTCHMKKCLKKNCYVTAAFLTGATATVSTLATVVGHPNTPISAGKGGFSLGLPAFRSRLSIRACRWEGRRERGGRRGRRRREEWKEGEEEEEEGEKGRGFTTS